MINGNNLYVGDESNSIASIPQFYRRVMLLLLLLLLRLLLLLLLYVCTIWTSA